MVGGCFPNDFENTSMKHDRGLAKTANLDPGVLSELPGPEHNRWHKMNAFSWHRNVETRITAKQWLRTVQLMNGNMQLSAWWNHTPK